ncbi:MAG: serine/threonine-protein kinase [Myxococcota bacterium]
MILQNDIGRTPAVGVSVAGQYCIEEVLGSGGMGVVYRAHDRILERDIALKVLRPSARAASSLAREGAALAAISHPHVVGVYAFGLHGDWPFLAMELVVGTSLRDLIAHHARVGSRPATRQCIRILRDIAAGISCAHKHGVAHRDLKPANVVVRTNGSATLIDFGLSTRRLHLSAHPNLVGTASYVAPESISGNENHSPVAGDLYALGCIAYELLTGKRAFSGTSDDEILAKHLSVPAPRLAAVRRDLPELDATIALLLDKRAEMRPDLRAVLHTLETELDRSSASHAEPSGSEEVLVHVVVRDSSLDHRVRRAARIAGIGSTLKFTSHPPSQGAVGSLLFTDDAHIAAKHRRIPTVLLESSDVSFPEIIRRVHRTDVLALRKSFQ